MERSICATAVSLLISAHLPALADEKAKANPVATVTGRVINMEGDVLPNVQIVVAVPAVDMRHVYPGSRHKTYSARTDREGRYTLEVPVAGQTSLAVNAMLKGYGSAAGTKMGGGDRRQARVGPGDSVGASFVLKRGLYVAGVVVDEAGKPLPDVQVKATEREPDSYGNVAATSTGADGRFEIFDFPLPYDGMADRGVKGTLEFNHDSFVANAVDDVYALDAKGQQNLRVVLSQGRAVAGTLLDEKGQPAQGEMVEIIFDDDEWAERRATVTDASGEFSLTGLPSKKASLRCCVVKRRVKVRRDVVLDHDQKQVELRLEPWRLKHEPKIVTLLGMEVADIDDDLRDACDLGAKTRGVFVFDPGPVGPRLGIRELLPGDIFWAIEDASVSSVRQFVERLLSETAEEQRKSGCHVAFSFRRPEYQGSVNPYIKLTADDVQSLKKLLESLP